MKKQYVLILAATLLPGLAPGALAADFELGVPSPAAVESGSSGYLRDALRRDTAQASAVQAWKLSLAPVAAAEFLDAYSSRGMRELNPVLAGPNGQFGAKAVLLKTGIAGAFIAAEYLMIRTHPSAAKVFWKINLISAGVTGGVAAHNFSLR